MDKAGTVRSRRGHQVGEAGGAGMRLGRPKPRVPADGVPASQALPGLGVTPGSWNRQKHLG